MSRKPHFSPSSIDAFCRCPEAWRRRYLEHEREPANMLMHRGTGVHAGMAENFRQKRTTFRDLPASQIVDAAIAGFEEAIEKDGIHLSPDQNARGAAVVVAEFKDSAAEMARAFREQQAPDYFPLMVEEPVRIDMELEHDLFGYVDLVATTPLHAQIKPELQYVIVPDFKTAKRRKRQSDVDGSTQLTFYAAATHLLRGKNPDEVRLDVLVANQGGVTRQCLAARRDEADYLALAERVRVIERAVQAGIFPPATPGAWWCSPSYCGFWPTCKYVAGRAQ